MTDTMKKAKKVSYQFMIDRAQKKRTSFYRKERK